MEKTILILSIFGVIFLTHISHVVYGFQRTLDRTILRKRPINLNFNSKYEYDTQFVLQEVDHFGFFNNDTFKQRYLISQKYWTNPGGPIFFYTGNEGDIELFCNNTGFMWDIAPEFSAIVVFAEHRYYGKSIPYGSSVFKNPAKMTYFTSEQALADYALLIQYLKSSIPGASKSPVIAFGGSYGGMLAAWFRMKYPNVITGSLAASAPIWEFTGLTPCGSFSSITTRAFNLSSPTCVENIRKSWKTFDTIGSSDDGMKQLTELYKLCKPITSSSGVAGLKSWLYGILGNLAMVNYPYPSSFLAPLPGWPVKAVCEPISNSVLSGMPLMEALQAAVQIYYNYTGTAKCLNTSQEMTQSLDDQGWSYQACTEMTMPFCNDGVHDMFEPSPWNFTSISDNCYKMFKVRPRPYWVQQHYAGKDISFASNIIFSNGHLDPWSGGGVLESRWSSLKVIVIKDGAHHLDLRGTNPKDTDAVKKARRQEVEIISQWLRTYYK